MDTKPVLLVTTSTFPRWEGDSEPRFVYDLCIRLTETFKVVVLAPHAAGTATEEVREGLHIHRYRYAPSQLETLAYEGGITANLKQNPLRWLLLPSFFLAQCLAIHRLLKSHQVSVIHAHWLIPQGVVATLAVKWSAYKPALLCTSHGGDLYGLQDRLSRKLKQWVVHHCQAITVVSTSMVDRIKALAGDHPVPVHVIPMGTDLTHTFVSDPNIPRLPNQLLFVGRLVEKKGVKYLLFALQDIIKTLPDTRLVIAGSGPLQIELEKLTAELGLSHQVSFAGRLEHSELVKLYQESTLAVFPFIQAKDGDMEGLGLVMVEAIGCGCPVLTSDLPAVRDVFGNNETYHLVPPGNSDLLATRIKEHLKQRNCITTSEPLHKKIIDAFSWHSIANRYQTTIKKITTTSPTFSLQVRKLQ